MNEKQLSNEQLNTGKYSIGLLRTEYLEKNMTFDLANKIESLLSTMVQVDRDFANGSAKELLIHIEKLIAQQQKEVQ